MQYIPYDGGEIDRLSDEYINRRLFAYMNDGETWYSSLKENGQGCNFHNPLNGTAYGLCFHKDERWLAAVEEKMTNYYLSAKLQFHITQRTLTIRQDNATGICLKGMITPNAYTPPKVVAHVHGLNYLDAKKLLLLDLVEIRATYLN